MDIHHLHEHLPLHRCKVLLPTCSNDSPFSIQVGHGQSLITCRNGRWRVADKALFSAVQMQSLISVKLSRMSPLLGTHVSLCFSRKFDGN